jgi:DNA-binding CsgD family transcriptional regulator
MGIVSLFPLMKETPMPRTRLSMRQVHEVLRLQWAAGLSDRQIARSLGLSRPTVAS